MYEAHLFLGFPVDSIFSSELKKINQNLVSHFIQNSDDYLTEIHHGDLLFYGKNVGKITSLMDLDLLEANIFSLLKKLLPDYPYQQTTLYLFPLAISPN